MEFDLDFKNYMLVYKHAKLITTSLVKSSSLSSSTKNNQISGEVSKLDRLLYV
jgi:hypothetical protein